MKKNKFVNTHTHTHTHIYMILINLNIYNNKIVLNKTCSYALRTETNWEAQSCFHTMSDTVMCHK